MSVVTLAEAKLHLNITANTDDAEIQTKIDAAEGAVVDKTGPLTNTSVTERVRGGGCALTVQVTPLVSVTSVTPADGGTPLDVSQMTTDEAGVIEYLTGARFTDRWYDVEFTAGHGTAIPANLKEGVLELVRHLWDTQRGGSRRPGPPVSTAASNTLPGAAYLFPFRVEQLIAPFVQVGN